MNFVVRSIPVVTLDSCSLGKSLFEILFMQTHKRKEGEREGAIKLRREK